MSLLSPSIAPASEHVARPPWQAYAAMIFGLICIATSGIFVRWAGLPGPVAAFYRTLIAASALAIPFGLRARQIQWSRRSLAIVAAAGVLFACDMGLWNTAVQYTSVANAVLLGNTAPIWVGLGAILLYRERLRRNFWLGLALALSGAAIILGADALRSPSLNLGNLLSLLVSLFYAAYMLITQRGRARFDALSYFWLTTVVSLITLFFMTRLFQQSLVVPAATFPFLLGMGLVTHIGGWLSVNYAQGHLPASLVSPTMLGQPVVAALFAFVLLGEALTLLQVVGGAVVLLGISLVHRARG